MFGRTVVLFGSTEAAKGRKMLQDLSQEGHVGPAEIEALRSRLKEVEEMMTAANDRGAREKRFQG